MATRRNFIRDGIGGLAAVTLAGSAFHSHIMPTRQKKLGVALVGLGYYSTDLLAPALQLTQHCSLAGIVTGTPAKAKKWQQQYAIADNNIYDYQSFDSIANNPAIDVVYVVLPPSMHAEYVIRAANAGKHVWCEKPMAMTEAECKSMIEACEKNKVKLSIGYRMQHEPNTQRIIRFGKEKTYGKILTLSAAAGYFDSRTDHWKQKKALGGGSMYDMGVYPLNAARYSTGEEPVAVLARQSTNRPEIYTEVDETMQFTLEFPSGAKAECETSFGKGMNTLAVKCEKGGYRLEPFQAYSGITGETTDGMQLNARIPNQQAKQMDDDALSITNKESMLVPGEEGLRDIRVVEAIYRAVRENKRVEL